MKCSFCDGKKFDKIYMSTDWEIVRCQKCNLVATSINQTVSYGEYYRDEQYHKEEKIFNNIFMKRYKLLLQYFKTPGKVLDIGASTGTMLDIFASHKWRTFGIEPSESHKISKKKGHTIYHSSFESTKLPNNFFDLVIINHTLEHVGDPSLVLSKIENILKWGGIVYIDVPNFGSLSRILSGSGWKYLLPHEHVHQFELETLQQIVNKSELKIIKSTTWSGIFDVAEPFSLLWYKLSHFKKSFFTDLVGIPGNIIATFLNRGTNLVVIAQK